MEMKKGIQILLIACMVMTGLAGCPGKEKRSSIGRGGRSSARYNQNTVRDYRNSGQQWTGAIVGEPQDSFQQATEGFVSAFMNPNELGEVSGQAGRSTGVRFGGVIRVAGGFDPGNSNNGTQIDEGASRLEVLVWDSEADQNESTPGILADQFRVVDYRLNNRTLSVVFEDSLGTVTFEGTFDNNTYYGEVWYDNFEHVDGGTPESWTWGTFYIPVCDFFECR